MRWSKPENVSEFTVRVRGREHRIERQGGTLQLQQQILVHHDIMMHRACDGRPFL